MHRSIENISRTFFHNAVYSRPKAVQLFGEVFRDAEKRLGKKLLRIIPRYSRS